jgi:hypothetical protein
MTMVIRVFLCRSKSPGIDITDNQREKDDTKEFQIHSNTWNHQKYSRFQAGVRICIAKANDEVNGGFRGKRLKMPSSFIIYF